MGSTQGAEIPTLYVPEPPATWIPPPPKQQYSHDFIRQNKEPYPFARVPSAHATLPKQYVSVPETELPNKLIANSLAMLAREQNELQSRQSERTDLLSKESVDKVSNTVEFTISDKSEKSKVESSNKSEKSTVKDSSKSKISEKIVNGMVVRDYKGKGTTPKFVPRQAMNLLKKKAVDEKKSEKPDSGSEIDKELKRNAFTLGKPQGPGCTEEQEQRVTEGEKSVQKTREIIRKRVSEVQSQNVLIKYPLYFIGTYIVHVVIVCMSMLN